MKSALELAVAARSQTLTFFLGAGFSKHLTGGKSPNWTELLVSCAKKIDSSTPGLRDELFELDPISKAWRGKVDLLVAAQYIEMEARRRGKDVRAIAAAIIDAKAGPSEAVSALVRQAAKAFADLKTVNIITTNYDSLLSDVVFHGRARVFLEGTIPRQINTGVNIFHVHGAATSPKSMVLTLSDYYRFLQRETYLSRKLHTLLQESTVAILGYGLGDFNLNSILNEAQGARAGSLRRADIFHVVREPVSELQALFHRFTYGIEVLGPLDVQQFFAAVAFELPDADKLLSNVDKLTAILNGNAKFTDEFLKLRQALERTFLRASVLGVAQDDPRLVKLLGKMLKRKQEFTNEDGAWDQYTHLAEWVLEIGARLDVDAVGLKTEFLDAAEYSLLTMSKELRIGKAWEAFQVWRGRAKELNLSTAALLKAHAKGIALSSDAKTILGI